MLRGWSNSNPSGKIIASPTTATAGAPHRRRLPARHIPQRQDSAGLPEKTLRGQLRSASTLTYGLVQVGPLDGGRPCRLHYARFRSAACAVPVQRGASITQGIRLAVCDNAEKRRKKFLQFRETIATVGWLARRLLCFAINVRLGFRPALQVSGPREAVQRCRGFRSFASAASTGIHGGIKAREIEFEEGHSCVLG